jgi:FtsP/CotA-like multicopper oxidase with cupredoxin domain
MSRSKTRIRSAVSALVPVAGVAVALLLGAAAYAAVPGIQGPSFDLDASADYISQPDGQMIYSWGYGCSTSPAGFAPSALAGSSSCLPMQLPGPTLIVTEGDSVKVTLTNNLPVPAGNTSIVFPGFQVTTSGGVTGLLTQEAAHGSTVTYTFAATRPGTYAYYSGTQPDLQVEMGLYGALIVLPSAAPSGCTKGTYSLAASAYDHPESCYDREYLFQFSEMSLDIHQQAETQASGTAPMAVATEPYQPSYYLVNGRSLPDDMDAPYSPNYVHQPYNANPHMHPGDLLLMRIIGQGRWQHPFHFHANHARVLARDGNLLLSQADSTKLAGPLLFTTPTVSGQTQDQIFSWTGQGLNWDVYGLSNPHTCNGIPVNAANPQSAGFDPVTHEYCPDHGKAIPVTPPDPNIVANGLWYGGTPYLGLQAANNTPLPPGQTNLNPDAGYAYMWHSHNEREITTNNVFPGGMMTMLIIDPPSVSVDETL